MSENLKSSAPSSGERGPLLLSARTIAKRLRYRNDPEYRETIKRKVKAYYQKIQEDPLQRDIVKLGHDIHATRDKITACKERIQREKLKINNFEKRLFSLVEKREKLKSARERRKVPVLPPEKPSAL